MATKEFKTIAISTIMAVVSFVFALDAKAQYPGSIAWEMQMIQRENAVRAQTAMMRQQILNYYHQQASAATWHIMNQPFVPMQGVQTYNGSYISSGESYTTETVPCDHCNGGYNYKDMYMGGGEIRTIKSRCNWCYGTGTIKRKVKVSE